VKVSTLIFVSILTLFSYSSIFAQCNLDFGTGGAFSFTKVNATDIINGDMAGANAISSQSFDIWDEDNGDCSVPGGLDDITFDFEILGTKDMYTPGDILDPWGGVGQNVIQAASGLKGYISLGKNGDDRTTAGDVRCTKITVTFAPHVEVNANDLTVNMSGTNATATAFESGSIYFLDAASSPANSPFTVATYNGYFGVGAYGPSTDGSCTFEVASADVYTVGLGAAAMDETSVIDLSFPCAPALGVFSGLDGKDINASTDAGLPPDAKIGGFVYQVCVEDVAASTAPLDETVTSIKLTNSLNGITISDNPLPVELIDFSARAERKSIGLNWSTASEENNARFEIGHSIDGKDFTPIGVVQGAGTTTELQNYNFKHDDIYPGRNYYRLRQVDFDGTFAYSPIVSALIQTKTEIEIYPTLVNNSMKLILDENIQTDIVMEIMDVGGHKVQQNTIPKGMHKTEFLLDHLEEGIYYVRFRGKRLLITQRIMKL